VYLFQEVLAHYQRKCHGGDQFIPRHALRRPKSAKQSKHHPRAEEGGAEAVSDYHPISVIHAIAKIIIEALAL
jgi:hypothetical protein